MQVNNVTSTNPVSANSTAKPPQLNAECPRFESVHANPDGPTHTPEPAGAHGQCRDDFQFSQLNSLQELREIHTGMDKLSASNQVLYLASLIGKHVKVNCPDGNILEGVVDGVITEKDNPQLRIGNRGSSAGRCN